MKFYVRLVVVVSAVIAALWLLREYGPSPAQQRAGPGDVSQSPASQTAAPTATSPADVRAGQTNVVSSPSLGGAPAAAMPQRGSAAAPVMVTPEDTAIQKFREMARAANVELVGYRRDGDWFVVTVRSPDRSRLFDFLDVAQRFGLRSLDTRTGPQYREYMGPGGRLYHEATHRMKF
ncbi:MAG: hypothetical protein N2Z21_04610 [Candidatus Sumerlaeaceae bacterium]|nr:hypothetical protein [Candidatus Sumerlaeaceae bacterium]